MPRMQRTRPLLRLDGDWPGVPPFGVRLLPNTERRSLFCVRTGPEELHADAVEALLDALRDAGLTATPTPDADVALHGPSGVMLIEVKAASVLDVDRARAQLEAHRREQAGGGSSHPDMVVLVADQLSEEARDLLRGTDWGYLDRRGALWMRRHDLIVNDTSIQPLARHRPTPDGSIRGRVALGVALRLLMHPRAHESVRDIADVVGASASTVHDALKQFRRDALIDAEHHPLVPDLFNEVAGVWRPERIPVRREPGPGDRDLELGLDDGTGHGWVVSGDVAAAASGVRIIVSAEAPPDFYVPTSSALRRALRQLGPAPFDERAATVALTPSPVVIAEHNDFGSPSLRWPVAHPVVVALDLAQDLARGREILADWTPQGFDRVW